MIIEFLYDYYYLKNDFSIFNMNKVDCGSEYTIIFTYRSDKNDKENVCSSK